MSDLGKGILGNRDATGEEIRRAMGHAINVALREHKQAGNPIAVWDWENDRVAIVPPEEIVVPEGTAIETEPAAKQDQSQG